MTREYIQEYQQECEKAASKITIQGNGWGKSSTIQSIHKKSQPTFEVPLDFKLYQPQRNFSFNVAGNNAADTLYSQTTVNEQVLVDSDSSLDYESMLNSVESPHETSTNSIRTILKKKPTITISALTLSSKQQNLLHRCFLIIQQ